MSIRVEEGKYYWRRDGKKEGPMKCLSKSPGTAYYWLAPSGITWHESGLFYRSRTSEYDLAARAPEEDGWVYCGDRYVGPVPPETEVRVQYVWGEICNGRAKEFNWHDDPHDRGIIAYQIVKPAPKEESDTKRKQDWEIIDELRRQVEEKDRQIAKLTRVLRRTRTKIQGLVDRLGIIEREEGL